MSKKTKGRKWDGKSRVSTDLYRKRWDEIFKKNTKKEKLTATEKLIKDIDDEMVSHGLVVGLEREWKAYEMKTIRKREKLEIKNLKVEIS